MKAVRLIGDYGYLPDAMKALVERYGFVGVPTTREEFFPTDPSTGITFRHGKLVLPDRTIIIDFLQIYQNGLLVTTRTNTSDSDLVIEDVFKWATDTFNTKYEPVRPGFVHSSQLEVRFELSLPELVPVVSSVGNAVTNRLDDFFEIRPRYELISLNFWFDKTKFPNIAPTAVRIDRREAVAFEQEVYWSEAPLSTQDHIEVLAEFENSCLQPLKKQ